ncbi:nitric oxide synthase oxygenase [Jannaschia sp. W003]|uniref:nitric oxide synthase oxygenase n=1 Tax=Jannaschia sp. W003 TaxID=2867012 RepID=UPI0021A34206|nr:nitric oxide synthase oxygenase [Jannaschia sp. W003]UWQ23121.1 nitric oxide synthase oxygenase [Jannaschia sp. W003]
MIRRRLSRIRTASADAGGALARRLRRVSGLERREEARAFLDAFAAATGATDAHRSRRWAEMRRGLSRGDYYEHTPEELAFGARLAWRNAGRCIGRLPWDSLEVEDHRADGSPEAIAAQIGRHLDAAYGDGRIRSIISIFPPVRGTVLPAWIESPQASQYACHVGEDGAAMGDRRNAEATRIARSMGWRPAGAPGPFDLLPVFLRDRDDRRIVVPPPPQTREVAIAHPDRPGLAALGLRWYAVPLVTDMILSIGGIDYPCAPFNGHYMCTEIASRNFADVRRYDMLEDVARALGLSPSPGDRLWRDVALTELNRAVLASFRAAGVTMIDHHAASDQFMTFHRREQSQGRRVAADWRWIVPPQASAACQPFHLKMRDFHPVPGFYRNRGEDGLRMMPWYGDRYRRRPEQWADRVLRRWKIWKRMAW